MGLGAGDEQGVAIGPLAVVSPAYAISHELQSYVGPEPTLFDTPEAAIAAFKEVMAKGDLKFRLHGKKLKGDFVLARIGAAGGPSLMLNGHLDTVGVERMTHAPWDPDVRDGRLYGRGSADMKGGIAVILAALLALEASPLAEKIGYDVVINSDEEISSLGFCKGSCNYFFKELCILDWMCDLSRVTKSDV